MLFLVISIGEDIGAINRKEMNDIVDSFCNSGAISATYILGSGHQTFKVSFNAEDRLGHAEIIYGDKVGTIYFGKHKQELESNISNVLGEELARKLLMNFHL